MRVIRSKKPFHRVGFGTSWVACTANVASRSSGVSVIGLFVLAGAATLRIFVPRRLPLWVPAWMLAAGLASGSRAGAFLLFAEAGVGVGLISQRRAAAKVYSVNHASRWSSGSGDVRRALREKNSVALPARNRGVHFETDRGSSLARLRARHLDLCLSGLRNFRYRRGGRARA